MKTTLQTPEQKYYTREYKERPREGYPQLDWKSMRANNAFVQEIRKVARKEDRILDLGCGSGRISFALARYGFEIWGVDFAPSAIKRAKELARTLYQSTTTHFIVGDALDLPYKKDFFDVVFDYGCLHHIREEFWPLYVRNVVKILKGGGYLVLYTHSAGSKFYKKNAPQKGVREFVVENVLTHFFGREDFPVLFGKYFIVVSTELNKHPATSNKSMWTVVLKRR